MLLDSNRNLPEELWDMIIVEVFHNSVHTVCTSSDDVQWELNILETLSGVSKSFKAIATEVACKALISAEEVKKYPTSSFVPEMRKIMAYLRTLGTRLRRHPSDWEDINAHTFDSPAALLVVGYALYVSSVTLRRNSMGSRLGIFVSTYHVTNSALTQSLSLCDHVSPKGMSSKLRHEIQEELLIAQSTHDVVQTTQELAQYTAFLKQEVPGSFLEDDVIKLRRRTSPRITVNRPQDPGAHEVLNVKDVLRDFQLVLVKKEDSSLHDHFDTLVREWSIYCPFLRQKRCGCDSVDTY
ncbi:hypothetical protein BDQ17DRAFT_1426329 [Cyathus striatus]|nr:hypothetical protein BDQ17DRAFT_1426329 [Cyathus striatus]